MCVGPKRPNVRISASRQVGAVRAPLDHAHCGRAWQLADGPQDTAELPWPWRWPPDAGAESSARLIEMAIKVPRRPPNPRDQKPADQEISFVHRPPRPTSPHPHNITHKGLGHHPTSWLPCVWGPARGDRFHQTILTQKADTQREHHLPDPTLSHAHQHPQGSRRSRMEPPAAPAAAGIKRRRARGTPCVACRRIRMRW